MTCLRIYHFGCCGVDGPFNSGKIVQVIDVESEKNEFVHDPNPFPYDNTPDFYDQPPQPQYETSCANYVGTILTLVMIVHHGSRFFQDACGVEVRLTVELSALYQYPLEIGVRCQQCTCVRCGHYLGDGFCSFCNSEAGNSFVNDSNLNSFNDPLNVFTHPPQP
ncbi:hypothetical protein Tco_0193994 [Tanacetum coccineum]